MIRNWWERAVSRYYTRIIWGDRCPGFEPLCPICRKWAEHDDIFEPSRTRAPLDVQGTSHGVWYADTPDATPAPTGAPSGGDGL